MESEADQSTPAFDTAQSIERVLAVIMITLVLVYLLTGTRHGLEPVFFSVEVLLGILGLWIHSKKAGFIQEDYDFEQSTRMANLVRPCGDCGEDYRHPVLSADGRYRCPKCAKPVG
ncbi:MAG: hypothetical protein ACXADS_09025 [Candidatus Thorarchaeota archaeon]|jgi:hypothetical protein